MQSVPSPRRPVLRVPPDALVAQLRAAGEATRLRLLALLSHGERTVKDLTTVLGQSQPRISRHLKLLTDAGLVARSVEGSWVYYRLAEGDGGIAPARMILEQLDPSDSVLVRDRERLSAVTAAQAEAAAAYFAQNAASWDHIRSLHVPEARVEAAMRAAVGERRVRTMLDLGTGTGRILELFADLYDRGLGVDASAPMLAVARANLERARIGHARVAQDDIYALSLPRGAFDLVTLHQVLHHLDEPARAIAEAARTLRPGGRLLVVDFAPHGVEALREEFAHRRLGFSHEDVASWMRAAGLEPDLAEDLAPAPGEGGRLTVTIWLGHDPRLLIAAPDTATHLETIA